MPFQSTFSSQDPFLEPNRTNSSAASPSLDSEESFADLFEDSVKLASNKKQRARRQIALGDWVSGIVVRVGKEFIFIDIGAKSEARMSVEDALEVRTMALQVGDRIEGRVILIDAKEGSIVLSHHIPKDMGPGNHLRTAFEQKIPVDGVVSGVNKGGLDVTIGGTRAFMPAAQIELRYCQSPAAYVGQTVRVMVTQYDEEDQNVVVSRRAILELEQREKTQQIQADLLPGKVFLGTVVGVQNYGAFVDIGGVEGFIHVSEIGYGRNLKPQDILKPGQQVEVVILRVEDALEKGTEKRKINLSLKALMQDPFSQWIIQVKEGQKVTGKVVRLEPFGAFVEIMQGVEGLIHISAITDRPIKHPKEVLQLGQEVLATVVRIDEAQKRIALSLTEEIRLARAAATLALTLGDTISVIVEKIEPFGLLVRIPGQEGGADAAPKGIIRNSELPPADRHEAKRRFPVGKEVRALVKKIEPNGRVELSIRAADEAEERSSMNSYVSTATASHGKATFADLLKKKGLIP